MSIATRIESIEEHIEQAYDELRGLGADLTNVNKNIENISMVLDDIYDSMPQVSGEGTNLTLDDTRVGKIKSTLKGNTSQDGTPTPSSPIPVNVVSGDNEINVVGKNLLNYVGNLKDNYGGLTSVINENGSITTTGIPTSSYTTIIEYDISSVLENGESYVFWQETPQAHTLYMQVNAISKSGGATRYYSLNTGDAFKTLVADTDNYKYIMNIQTERTDSWGSSSKTITNKYMLELGTTPTDFEPYQGNTYNIDLPVENLFDKSTATLNKGVSSSTGSLYNNSDSFATDYIPIQNGKSYTMNSYSSSNVCFGALYDSSKAFLEGFTTSQNNKTVTINNANAKYIRITGQKVNIDTYQLEKGSKANSYTPYGTAPIELCKIGNYQDYFYKDSGKWYLHKEIGKVVLNGSESWAYALQSNVSRFDITIPNAVSGSATNNPILSTHFKTEFALADKRIFLSGYGNTIAIMDNDFSNTNDFKNWLSINNVTCYYGYTTPTNTEITYQPLIDQLNLLEKAMSKDGQTNISQVNNDLPFIISASALKEWQESTSLNSTLSMVSPLSLGNTLNTQENDIQPIEVDNIEPLEEEENEES